MARWFPICSTKAPGWGPGIGEAHVVLPRALAPSAGPGQETGVFRSRCFSDRRPCTRLRADPSSPVAGLSEFAFAWYRGQLGCRLGQVLGYLRAAVARMVWIGCGRTDERLTLSGGLESLLIILNRSRSSARLLIYSKFSGHGRYRTATIPASRTGTVFSFRLLFLQYPIMRPVAPRHSGQGETNDFAWPS